MLRTLIVGALAAGIWGCTDNRTIDQRVRDGIEACASSENCYLLDAAGNRQLIARPASDAGRPLKLCGIRAEIVEISNEETDHSGLFKGQCNVEGIKAAQITLWYFSDGRYNLTIEDCQATGCKRGWFMPI